MGSWHAENINNSGTENDFIALVYDFVKGLYSGITCDLSGYVTKEDADASDIAFIGNTITNIDFNLSENVILRFQSYPSDNLSKPYSGGYNFAFKINGANIVTIGSEGTKTNSDTCLRFSSTNPNAWGAANRSFTVAKYVSDNVVVFWIGDYTATSWKDAKFSFVKFKDTNNNVKWAVKAGANAIDDGFIKSDDGSLTYTRTNMFSYEARTGYLDFISHSNYLSAGIKAFTSTDIYDCTTVNFGDTLSLKDGANFLAIGAHSMVPINDEEE